MSISLDGSLHNALKYIMEGIFNGAKNEPLKGHPLATLIRNDFKEVLCPVVQGEDQNLKVEASAGQGEWATIVWGAVLDPLITRKTSCGYFVVYHFHSSGQKVFLSICQGARCVKDDFGVKEVFGVLEQRGVFAKKRLTDLLPSKLVDRIELGSVLELPRLYEAAFIAGKEYRYDRLPSEVELRYDLKTMCALYRALHDRGYVLSCCLYDKV